MSFIKMRDGNTPQKRVLHMRSLTTDLIMHGQIKVTLTDGKELTRHIAKMVTLAKKGTLHARRQAASWVIRADVKEGQNTVQKLFDEIGPKYKDRNGGYTRILKLENRRGDNTPMCLIAFV